MIQFHRQPQQPKNKTKCPRWANSRPFLELLDNQKVRTRPHSQTLFPQICLLAYQHVEKKRKNWRSVRTIIKILWITRQVVQTLLRKVAFFRVSLHFSAGQGILIWHLDSSRHLAVPRWTLIIKVGFKDGFLTLQGTLTCLRRRPMSWSRSLKMRFGHSTPRINLEKWTQKCQTGIVGCQHAHRTKCMGHFGYSSRLL